MNSSDSSCYLEPEHLSSFYSPGGWGGRGKGYFQFIVTVNWFFFVPPQPCSESTVYTTGPLYGRSDGYRRIPSTKGHHFRVLLNSQVICVKFWALCSNIGRTLSLPALAFPDNFQISYASYTPWHVKAIQSNLLITRSITTRNFTCYDNGKWRIAIGLWTPTRHPIPHPLGWAMGYLLWVLEEKTAVP